MGAAACSPVIREIFLLGRGASLRETNSSGAASTASTTGLGDRDTLGYTKLVSFPVRIGSGNAERRTGTEADAKRDILGRVGRSAGFIGAVADAIREVGFLAKALVVSGTSAAKSLCLIKHICQADLLYFRSAAFQCRKDSATAGQGSELPGPPLRLWIGVIGVYLHHRETGWKRRGPAP